MKQTRRTFKCQFVATFFTAMLFGSQALALGIPFPVPPSEGSSGGSNDSSNGSSGGTPRPAPTPAPTPRATPKPTQPGSTAPLWESKRSDGKEWTSFVMNKLDTLGSEILDGTPDDVATFCPRYGQFSYGQKKEFWTYLISAMVKQESSFNPSAKYTESFNDAKGKNVISRGLLQISIESANSYGCGFANAQELHDPYENLACGIRILNRWLGRDNRIAGKVNGGWKGGARYWSVLRTTSGSYSTILKLTKALPLCQ